MPAVFPFNEFDVRPQYLMYASTSDEYFEFQPYKKSVIIFGCSYCGNNSGKQDERGNCVSCGAPLESRDND